MVKILVVRKADNIITDIVDTAVMVSNGLKVTDATGTRVLAYIPDCNTFTVDVPAGVEAQKSTYDSAVGFGSNPSYVAPVDILATIADIQAQSAQLILTLVDKGVI